MSNDLQSLLGSKSVIASGETLTIKAFPFGKFPTVLEKIADLLPFLETGDMLGLVTQGGENVIALMMLATGKSREWFDTLDPAEGVDLVTAVVEVNKRFFEQKVKPLLDRMKKQSVVEKPITESLSDALSDTDTAGTQSKATP